MGNFKDCKKCKQVWTTRDEFLNDDNIVLIGFMADNNELEKGAFLFNHVLSIDRCNTTFGVYVSDFLDMYKGEVYKDLKLGTEECSGHCAKVSDIEQCNAHCRNAVAREIMGEIINKLPAMK
jgi:hypothetical protein